MTVEELKKLKLGAACNWTNRQSGKQYNGYTVTAAGYVYNGTHGPTVEVLRADNSQIVGVPLADLTAGHASQTKAA